MALTDLVRRTWSQRQSLAARGGVDECLSYAREEGYEPDETFLHAIVLCLFSGGMTVKCMSCASTPPGSQSAGEYTRMREEGRRGGAKRSTRKRRRERKPCEFHSLSALSVSSVT
jgi:hypothetical protein